MILVSLAYRELNADSPDSGTTFTWVTKAFGPWVGWMGGWGCSQPTSSSCPTWQGSPWTSSTCSWPSSPARPNWLTSQPTSR
jgi:hypothetical protein